MTTNSTETTTTGEERNVLRVSGLRLPSNFLRRGDTPLTYMELATNYKHPPSPRQKHKVFPAHAQRKYDGVPLTFLRQNGRVLCLTRQNEEIASVQHLIDQASFLLNQDGASFVGECLVPGLPFKESSGLIRRSEPCPKVICIVFDADLEANRQMAYHNRFVRFRDTWQTVKQSLALTNHQVQLSSIFPCPTTVVQDHDEAMQHFLQLQAKTPDIEGMMLHTCNKPFMPGKRAPGMVRYKPQPTIDLEVDSFEEAISEAGEGLCMVGRVNVRLTRRMPSGDLARSVVGVGPGKLSHDQRRVLWHRWTTDQYRPIVEIKFMPDPTYDALRQPTIQRVRDDKGEPDIYDPLC